MTRREVLRRKRGNRRPPRPAATSSQPRIAALPSQPIWPLTAPGMPLPSGNLLDQAVAIGDSQTKIIEEKIQGTSRKIQRLESTGRELIDTVRNCMYSSGEYLYRYVLKGHREAIWPVIGGHLWEPEGRDDYGPRPATVMVIGKMLGEEEVNARRHFVGPSGRLLLQSCRDIGIRNVNDWYMTDLIKTPHPEGYGQSTLRVPWIKEWMLILQQELRLVQPDYILCVGSDSSKALLGKQATIKHMEGQVVEYEIPRSRKQDDNISPKTALVMSITHPAQILAAPEMLDKFKNQLARFGQLTQGIRWDREEVGLDHRVIRDIDSLRDLVHEINADIEENLLAFDAEWHGQHPQNKGSYLRTIQLSWKYKTAAAIVFYDEKGKPLYDEDEMDEIKDMLEELVSDKRLAAHFGDADLEWLEHFGFHWQQYYHNVPSEEDGGWSAYMRSWIRKKPGGFDTGLAAHALLETDDFGLTSQALKRTAAPRYDMKLLEWKKDYCKEHKLKDAELEGFGPCPDDVLLGAPDPDRPGHHKLSYACYDADVVWRLVGSQQRALCCDSYGNNCWEPFWMSMRAQPAVLEINRTGVMLDKERVDSLTELYMSARARLEQKIRDWARWPDLNLNSVFQIREFLFGEHLNGKEKEKPEDPPVRLRPEGARSLKLRPIITTDKRPMPWLEVMRQGLEHEKTPSTNKTALEILRQEATEVRKKVRGRWQTFDLSDQVMWIRDYRFISQVLKSSLRPPILDVDEDSGDEVYRQDDDGHYVYAGGLASAVCSDGRVRTHIYPTKETRRWSSARPPLQNLTKRREVDYKRILEDAYTHPLRTILTSGEGTVLIEADYVGAELFGMAIMSGDVKMIEHAMRNQLPEDDPNFYDIHSNVAVLAFNLDCEPTKHGLKDIGKSHLRICAKAVVFGIAYGRGAKAIALQCREEGVPISELEAQNIIDTVFSLYPDLVPFFDECRQRALNERFLVGCFGGHRRFPMAFDFKTQGDFERQAMNFPMQNMVADAVSRAVDHLYHYRDDYSPEELDYRIALQVHDAVLLEVPYKHVGRVVTEVLPTCMVDRVPIFPTDLAGFPLTEEPYRFGIDVEVFHHWGAAMTPGEFMERKISPKFGGFKKGKSGWYKPGKPDVVWRKNGWVNLAA